MAELEENKRGVNGEMILGFKKQFVDKIKKHKTKIHTIREDNHNRWRAGNIINFATGVGTKAYHQFDCCVCISVQKIEIIYGGFSTPQIIVDGKTLPIEKHFVLARNDGFGSKEEFYEWFAKDFTGKIIHWTGWMY